MIIAFAFKYLKCLNRPYVILVFCSFFSDISAQWTELNSTPNINQPFQRINGGTSDNQGNIYTLLSSTVQASKTYIAKWDGISWTEVANSKTSQKYDKFVRVHPDNQGSIYTWCDIDGNTNNPKTGIVKWDGVTWTEIFSINHQTYINELYSNGDFLPHCFNSSGDMYFVITKFKLPIQNNQTDSVIQTLYKWNNISLTLVYQSLLPIISGLQISDIQMDSHNNIYACGSFTNTNSNSVLNYGYTVVKWNGTSWNEVYGINHLTTRYTISKICIDNKDNIYSLSRGCTTGNNSLNNIYYAKWDGVKWVDLDPLNKLDTHRCIYAMSVDSSGNFYIASSSEDQLKYYIHKWNGNEWFKIDFPICNFPSTPPCGNVSQLCFDKNQDLVAQGYFQNAKGDFYVAKYNRTQFVGLTKKTMDDNFFIYPNPTTNKLNFNLDNTSSQKFNLSLTNGLGQTVITKQNADLNEGLDISNLSSGIYFLKIQNQTSQKTFKVVKE